MGPHRSWAGTIRRRRRQSRAPLRMMIGLGLDLGRAAGRESPMKTPTAFVASGEKDWSGGGGSAVSAARRRMIADRARRILEGDDSD